MLKAFAVDLSEEMPYHETLAVFGMRMILDFVNSNNEVSIVEKANNLIEKIKIKE